MIALAVWLLLAGATTAWLRARRPPGGERITLRTADGWSLQLWIHRAPVRRWQEPVVLVHGLATDHRVLCFPGPESMAGALNAAGFDCYLPDLRDNRSAVPPARGAEVSFDDLARYDVPAVVTAARQHSGAAEVLWVGHSLGGLVALAAGALPLRGLVTLGSPVFFGVQRSAHLLARLGLALTFGATLRQDLLAALVVPLAGWLPWPARVEFANLRQLRGPVQRWILACSLAPIWKGVLRQLLGWLRSDRFSDLEGLDHRPAVRALQVPCLLVGGTIDRLAPPEVVRAHFDLLTAPDKTCWLLGREHGQVDDYGHGDLVLGRRTPEELYPRLAEWLSARASPLTGEDAPGTRVRSATR